MTREDKHMSKKLFGTLLSISLVLALLAGCGGSSGQDASGDEAPVDLYMFISQPEYADAINELISEYKNVKPHVTINYETTQADYPVLLRARINSDNIPDIFSSTSGKEIDMYMEYSHDLSGQPMMQTMLPAVQDTMRPMDGDGIHGFAIKGNYFGTLYNKDIFAEAGVEQFPETLTELEEACVKIEAAGYQPFTSGFAEWWVFKHSAMPFFGAASDDAKDLIARFERGEAQFADYPILYDNFFRYIDIVKQYGDNRPLETDLSAQIAAFANGKAAMTNGQGAWIEADVLRINPDINIGFNGYAVSEDAAQCVVVTGADQALRVSNASDHLQEVLDFVNWWYTSDYGIAWFTDVADVVPPVATAVESDFEVIKQGGDLVAKKGSGPLTVIYSTDSFHAAFGEAMQAYVGGWNDKEATIAAIEELWLTQH